MSKRKLDPHNTPRYQRFKIYMNLRPIVVGIIPFVAFWVLMALFPDELPQLGEPNLTPMLCTIVTLIWAVVLFYVIWRAPRPQRWHESDEAYRQRVGYQERPPAP